MKIRKLTIDRYWLRHNLPPGMPEFASNREFFTRLSEWIEFDIVSYSGGHISDKLVFYGHRRKLPLKELKRIKEEYLKENTYLFFYGG